MHWIMGFTVDNYKIRKRQNTILGVSSRISTKYRVISEILGALKPSKPFNNFCLLLIQWKLSAQEKETSAGLDRVGEDCQSLQVQGKFTFSEPLTLFFFFFVLLNLTQELRLCELQVIFSSF